MQKTLTRLILIILSVTILASCNTQDVHVDEPVETHSSQGSVETDKHIVNGTEDLSFPNQDTAIAAHQNMLEFFSWSFGSEDIDKMPDNYGGSYINKRNVFTVNVVNPDEESIALYEEACGKPIAIVAVSYSLKELLDTANAIRESLTDDKSELYSVAVNESENRIDALMNKSALEEIALLLADYPYIEISVSNTALTLSQHGDTPTDDDVVIVPEFPIYDPGMEYIDFTMHNKGKKEVMFGAGDYELDVLLNGVWYNIPMKPMAFVAIGYTLNPNSHRYRRVNLSYFDYPFAPGKYRVIQEFDGCIYFGDFELGESKITAETPYGYVPLEEMPSKYTLEMAESDGCIVLGNESTYNRILRFLDKVHWQMPSIVRIASESYSGEVIITDIEYGRRQQDNLSQPLVHAFYYTQPSPTGDITEEIFTFLNHVEIDNGIDIIFSNYKNINDIDIENVDHTMLTLESTGSFDALDEIKELCEQISERYELNSTIEFYIYSESGLYSAGLSDEPLHLYVQEPGQSERIELPAGMADEITTLEWISEDRLQLIGVANGIPNSKIAVFNTGLWDFE